MRFAYYKSEMSFNKSNNLPISQILIIIVIVSVIALMVIPLKPFVLDVFLVLNLSFSLSILMTTIFINNTMKLSTLPTLLLVCTLFRLGLNISSTRLILSEGQAGDVINSFGFYVAQGNIVVGLIVFSVLMVIQFLVISKGAERVAEVSARFSLDALPGKQMSIDSDLRAGVISRDEALCKRQELIGESKLYGAMDGAMKFVKGDTIAGFIITLINIFGGFCVGYFQKGLGLSQAFSQYVILTVGDGLVTQIPAFLLALAAGFLITRSSSYKLSLLGEDIAWQMMAYPWALFSVGCILLLLGLLPGFPGLVFILLTLIFFALSSVLFIKNKKRKEEGMSVSQYINDDSSIGLVTPLYLELSPELFEHFIKEERWRICFNDILPLVLRKLSLEIGVTIPDVKIKVNENLPEYHYRINIYAIPIDEGILSPHHCLTKELEAVPNSLIQKTYNTVHGTKVNLFKLNKADYLRERGINILNPEDVLLRHLVKIIKRNAGRFVGIQEVRNILNSVEEEHAELVKEVVPRLMTIQKFTEVLKRLVVESIPVSDYRQLLHILAAAKPDSKSVTDLAEHVRIGLKNVISHKHARDGVLNCFCIDPEIEKKLVENTHKNDGDEYIAIDPKEKNEIVKAIKSTYLLHKIQYKEAVILTQASYRRLVRSVLVNELPDVSVISYSEMEPWVKINQRDTVSLNITYNATSKEMYERR